jgi:electron transfer flavoprotein beta subunit
MKCLVPVKRVIDYNVKVRVKSDGSGVETEHVKMSLNPFDEIALEEAARLKEAGVVTEIVAVSIGVAVTQETLRIALARGADRALLIETEETFESLNIAKILKKIIDQENPNLVLMGKQAIDDDANQTGQMLAALLGWPQGTFASKVEIIDVKSAVVTREVDGGLETLRLSLPAIITTDLRLNEPRYISLPNVMRAKSKPLEKISLGSLGLSLKKHIETLKVEAPKIRKSGIKVNSIKELADKIFQG